MQEIGPDHEKVRFARTKLYATRRQIQRQGANGAQGCHGLYTVVDDGGVGRRMGRYEKSCVTVWRANFSFFVSTIHMARSQPKPARTDSGRSTPELAKRLSYVRYLNQLYDQGRFKLQLA